MQRKSGRGLARRSAAHVALPIVELGPAERRVPGQRTPIRQAGRAGGQAVSWGATQVPSAQRCGRSLGQTTTVGQCDETRTHELPRPQHHKEARKSN